MSKTDSPPPEGLINSPAAGFRFAFKGMRLIMRPGLRRYVVVPVLINIVVFAALAWFGVQQFDAVLDRWLPEDSWLAYFRWLLWPLFAAAFLLIMFFTFTVIANLLGAPFNDLLSARVEMMLSGQKPQDAPGSLLSAIGHAIRSELKKVGYFLPRAVPLLLLFVIPGLNTLAPLAWGLFSAWALALEYTEYPFGNNGILFRAQRLVVRQRRFTALGFGGGVMLLMLIPGVSLVAMPASVAGATALWVARLKAAAIPSQGETP